MNRLTNTDQTKGTDRQASGNQPDNSTPTGDIPTAVPPGTGTVTSISEDGSGTVVLTPDPITTTGTVGLQNLGGAAGPIGDSTHVAAVTKDNYGRVTALSSVAIAFPALPNVGTAGNYQRVTTDAQGRVSAGFNDWINVKNPAYGAVGDGSTDDAAAIALAILACRPNGGIDRCITTAFGTGYTSVPTIAFSGGTGSGAAATALIADVGANGKLGSIAMTARGSGYKTYAKTCAITSGNPTVGCTDTSNLANGLAVNHYSIPAGTTIVSFVANTSVTLSANPTASNAFADTVFGIPIITFSGGGGSGAAADAVIGNGDVLFFPPGDYRMTNGMNLTGLHNFTVIAPRATLFIDNVNSTGVLVDEFSRSMKIFGLTIVHLAAVFGNSGTRDFGCGMRIAGDMIEVIDCEAFNSPEFGILFGRDRTTGSAMYDCRLINFKANQTCGDGIHVTNGCGGLQIANPMCVGTGDDAIGIVADYGAGNQPTNITINGYDLRKGGFRGIALLGCINVQVGSGNISNMEGYGIEVNSAAGANAEDISVVGFHVYHIGSGGAGASLLLRDGLVVINCDRGKFGPGFIDTTTDYGYYTDTCTDVQFNDIMVLNALSGDFLIAGGTRVSNLYRAAGALKYRGNAGTVSTIAPS